MSKQFTLDVQSFVPSLSQGLDEWLAPPERGRGYGKGRKSGTSTLISPGETETGLAVDAASEAVVGAMSSHDSAHGPGGSKGRRFGKLRLDTLSRGGPVDDDSRGGGPPEGKGHDEEGVGNNLSFPVIFPQGVTPLTLRGGMDDLKLTDPYFIPGQYTSPELGDGYYWFHQKSEGNEWQAYNEIASGPIGIDKIDVGDALESARIALGRFVRIELALLKDIGDPETPDDGQLAYYMENIDGQGKTEVQGTPYTGGSLNVTDDFDLIEALDGLTTYRSDLATVYAPSNVMNLTIQKFEDGVDLDNLTGLEWNGDQWIGAGMGTTDYAANTAFDAELTVSGKVISGVSGKPFSFNTAGNYRITFEIENGVSIFLDRDTKGYNVAGARAMEIVPDGEQGLNGLDTHNGLIFLDVQVPSSVSGDEGELDSQFLEALTVAEIV